MVVNYTIDIDLVNPGPTHRIHVKQGDVKSRCVYINLLENGEAWKVNRTVQAVIRYRAQSMDGAIMDHGMYDTLEDGSAAYLLVGNVLSITPNRQMTANAGLVTVDVLLAEGEKMVSTFHFELEVHPSLAVEAGN